MISPSSALRVTGFCCCGIALLSQLAGCSSTPDTTERAPTGRYQHAKDFGPTGNVDMSQIPDAVPRHEVRTKAGNKSPYTVLDNTYEVMGDEKGYRERGIASWYGMKFNGHATSNGERYDIYKMTGAHKTLPIPSYARVTNLDSGRSVIVRINDRGPFHEGRIIDLSYAAATRLDYANKGTARVEVVAVTPDSMAPEHQGLASRVTVEPVPEQPTVENLPVNTASVVMNIESGGKVVNVQQDATQNYQMPSNTRLQAGAFSTREAADNVRQKLSALTTYPVTVSELSTTDRTMYRVRVGPIIDNAALLELQEILQRNMGAPPRLVYD